MLKSFRYTNKKGETKDRVVYITCPASESHLGLDLSEFSIEDRDMYVASLEEIHKEYMMSIKELDLKWRRFLVDSIY